MRTYENNFSSQTIRSPVSIIGFSISSGIFFICYFLYTYVVIEPAIFFQSLALQNIFPSFYTGREFLEKFISVPGGPVEYLSALLSQSFFSSFFGSIVITVIAVLTCYCTVGCLRHFNVTVPAIFIFIPTFLQIAIYNHYFHMMHIYLSFLAAVFSATIFFRFAPGNVLLRSIIFFPVVAVTYYLLGGAVLIFIFLISLNEIFVRRRIYYGVLFLSAFLTPMLVGVVVFGLSKITAYLAVTPFYWDGRMERTNTSPIIMAQCLFVFVPVITLIALLCKKVLPTRIFKNHKQHTQKSLLSNSMTMLTLHIVLLVLLAGLTVYCSISPTRNLVCKMDYYNRNEKWTEILQLARQIPLKFQTPQIIHYVNRALFETGQLGEQMFSYVQNPNTFFVDDRNTNSIPHLALAVDLNYSLGNFNYAEKLAVNAFEMTDFLPFILEKLAKIEIAKGQTKAAMIILNSLSKDLVYAKRARMLLENMDKNTFVINANQQLLLPEKDYSFTRNNYVFILPELLKVDPQNKMAFEYLMADHLLNKRLGKVIENFKYLKDLGYEQIPTLYQEAAIIYTGLTKKTIDLGSYNINPEFLKRAKKFSQTYSRFMPDKKAARDALAKEFSASYFSYFFLNVTGVVQ